MDLLDNDIGDMIRKINSGQYLQVEDSTYALNDYVDYHAVDRMRDSEKMQQDILIDSICENVCQRQILGWATTELEIISQKEVLANV